MKEPLKIVIKIGSSALTQGTPHLSKRYMLSLAQQISDLRETGKQVILVSSGAIAAGRELLNSKSETPSIPNKQMLASLGQAKLMQTWSELFALFEVHVGQLLLTRDDFSDRKRYLNARDTFNSLLHHHFLPIVNENDTIATSEIRVGDNDNLAALVATLIAADLMILLTDQKGLYTADPRKNTTAELIKEVRHIDDSIFALAGGSGSSLGTGGMYTKIEASHIAVQCGTKSVIASSSHPNVLKEIVAGNPIGTMFTPETTYLESRKRWLLSDKREGSLCVDAGAADSILTKGSSLLPSGIIKTKLKFERGATIQIVDPSGRAIAVGTSNYNSDDIDKLIGKHSREIAEVLGYTYGPEIVHRTDMTRIKGTLS
jgi:glutamate 5-kinase